MPFGSWTRYAYRFLLPCESFNNTSCSRCNCSRVITTKILIGGTYFMKIVVVKSPKVLSSILRLAFGIKKEN